MDDLERAITALTPARLRTLILLHARGEDGEARRAVGVATVAGSILDSCSFGSGAARSKAYGKLVEQIALQVALIPDMTFVEGMA